MAHEGALRPLTETDAEINCVAGGPDNAALRPLTDAEIDCVAGGLSSNLRHLHPHHVGLQEG